MALLYEFAVRSPALSLPEYGFHRYMDVLYLACGLHCPTSCR